MLTVIMNFHFFRGKDNNNNTNINLLSSTVHCFSLCRRCNQTPVSKVCETAPKSLFQALPFNQLDLNACYDWPVKGAIVDLPIRFKGIRNTLNSHTHTPI